MASSWVSVTTTRVLINNLSILKGILMKISSTSSYHFAPPYPHSAERQTCTCLWVPPCSLDSCWLKPARSPSRKTEESVQEINLFLPQVHSLWGWAVSFTQRFHSIWLPLSLGGLITAVIPYLSALGTLLLTGYCINSCGFLSCSLFVNKYLWFILIGLCHLFPVGTLINICHTTYQ